MEWATPRFLNLLLQVRYCIIWAQTSAYRSSRGLPFPSLPHSDLDSEVLGFRPPPSEAAAAAAPTGPAVVHRLVETRGRFFYVLSYMRRHLRQASSPCQDMA
jgi:hypothetical protein